MPCCLTFNQLSKMCTQPEMAQLQQYGQDVKNLLVQYPLLGSIIDLCRNGCADEPGK